MQIDLEDVQALSDSLDRVLASYPAGVASLQSLKNPAVLREQTEEQLTEIGVRYLFNPLSSGGVDLRAMALLAQRCGRSLFHGSSLLLDVVGGYVVSQLASLPYGLSQDDFAEYRAALAVPLRDGSTGTVVSAERNAMGWTLNGLLSVVPYADRATHLLVAARVDHHEIRHFMLDLKLSGVTQTPVKSVDGSSIRAVNMSSTHVPLDAMLGAEEVAIAWAQGERHATLALCFEAVGLMEALLQKSTEYLQIRKQFGKVIGSFQALQHRMVGVLLLLEQTRSAAQLALDAMQQGDEDQNLRLSAAKYAVGVNGLKVAEECIQLHGGIGMTWELDVSHYAKRLVMLDHYFDNADECLTQVMAGI